MSRDILYALCLLSVLFTTAIVFYHFLEGWEWVDAAYFAAATVTTVGYGDLVPTTSTSKLFTICYMLIGVSTGFYVIFSLGKARDSALRSRFEHLFETMSSFQNSMSRRRNPPTEDEGKFVSPKFLSKKR